MVDNHIKRSLNSLHINKCNQVDVLVGSSCFSAALPDDDLPKEEYMETVAISMRSDDLFTDFSGHPGDEDLDDDSSLKSPPNLASAADDLPELGGKQDQIDECYGLEQLDRICRCCLSDRRDLQSLFENENCISDMIMAIASVQVTKYHRTK